MYPFNKTKHELVTEMCYTMRHDYGLEKDPTWCASSGMTLHERLALYKQMEQLFDNVILNALDKGQ